MRSRFARMGRRAALGMLLCGGLWLAGCGNAYLDDFPEYEPAEPFLENQVLMQKRIAAAQRDRSAARQRALAERRAKAMAEWRQIQRRQREGLQRLERIEARQAATASDRTQPERLREWRRIMR